MIPLRTHTFLGTTQSLCVVAAARVHGLKVRNGSPTGRRD
jgi:hypothetical protein